MVVLQFRTVLNNIKLLRVACDALTASGDDGLL